MEEIKKDGFIETVKGDNYIFQFENGGLRLEIFDEKGGSDTVFGELSKNVRLIPYGELTVTVFPARRSPADKPIMHALLRVGQTDDGFEEEGSVPYSEKLISIFKKYGVKVVNDDLAKDVPERNEKPEFVYKIFRNAPLKAVVSAVIAAASAVALVFALVGILPVWSMIMSGPAFMGALSFFIVAVSCPDKLIFYENYFAYKRGNVPALFLHKKSIEAISVVASKDKKKRLAAFFIPLGTIEAGCDDGLYEYINRNLKNYTKVFDE